MTFKAVRGYIEWVVQKPHKELLNDMILVTCILFVPQSQHLGALSDLKWFHKATFNLKYFALIQLYICLWVVQWHLKKSSI